MRKKPIFICGYMTDDGVACDFSFETNRERNNHRNYDHYKKHYSFAELSRQGWGKTMTPKKKEDFIITDDQLKLGYLDRIATALEKRNAKY